MDSTIAEAAAAAASPAPEEAWQSTITRISSAIVNIRISSVRSIEANRASYGYATGFVGESLSVRIILLDEVSLPTILRSGRRPRFDPFQPACCRNRCVVSIRILDRCRLCFGAGPVRMEAVFFNKEEVELIPIYRDPVHDFGTLTVHNTKTKCKFFIGCRHFPFQSR